MAKSTVLVSDITGSEIADEADRVRVTFVYSDRSRVVLDASREEVAEMAAKGKGEKPRGRKPASATA